MARNRGQAQYLGFQCPIDTPGIPVIKPWKPTLTVLLIHLLFNSEPKVVTPSLLVSRKNSESCLLCLDLSVCMVGRGWEEQYQRVGVKGHVSMSSTRLHGSLLPPSNGFC